MMKRLITAILLFFLASPAIAQPDTFEPGPLIPEFGLIADIEGREPIPEGTMFKVAYDLKDGTEPGEVSRALTIGARFLNMHAAAGVPAGNMELAFVLHGASAFDVLNDERYREEHGEDNATAALVAALLEHNVKIYVCGQTAAYRGIAPEDLLPGVRMSLSAMTAHALLQQEGYTLNPF